MNKQPRMTNERAIEIIECNYPPVNYTMLREALDIAIESLGKVDPDPIPLLTIKPGDRVLHGIHGMGTVDVPVSMVYVKFDKHQSLMFKSVSELEVIPNE